MKDKKPKQKNEPKDPLIINVCRVMYSILFLIACAVPGATMFMARNDPDGATAEKRLLADAPDLFHEDGSFNRDFSSEAIAYVSDHFGFREDLVAVDAQMKADLLHVSAEPKVIIGNEGWLYYTPTADDFIGRPTVTPLGLQNILYNLELSRSYVESHGAKFVIAVVPNKNSIYPEYMPYNYANYGTVGNYGNLVNAMEKYSPALLQCWCDLHGVLAETAETPALPALYHKQDTHWNNIGALTGYRAIMDVTGAPYKNYADAKFTAEQTWEGDLEMMLFPGTDVRDTQYKYDIPYDFEYMGRYRSSDDLNIHTECASGTGSLLMFRDSFGAAVIPYFSENFASADYSRARPNPYYNLDAAPYDTVVMEIVERNIPWLQKEAPMHAAIPAEPLPEPHASRGGTLYTAQTNSAFLQLYGTLELPEDLNTTSDYVVTLTAPDGSSASYLAYHCYEADLLKTDTIGDNGYSLYIPAESLIPGTEYSVSMTFRAPRQIIGYQLGTVSLPAPDAPAGE